MEQIAEAFVNAYSTFVAVSATSADYAHVTTSANYVRAQHSRAAVVANGHALLHKRHHQATQAASAHCFNFGVCSHVDCSVTGFGCCRG